ncbi:AAA family ATPase [Curtobacterium sp. RRHDQ10]|uniref:AAA family ATPase n=1 Tax=Curtobacterium phyllosphaerae TaxID=3413379 RepID=UPI003BF40DF4
MLGPADPLSPSPRRVVVAGPSGVGKTSIARRNEAASGIRHTEVDALFHGPGWVPRPEFRSDVETFTSEPSWVTEWSYSSQLGDLLEARADTMVWLDFPVWVHMGRLVRRTLRRRLRREALWNGNVEPSLWTFFTDPDHIVRWGWRARAVLRRRVADVERTQPHLRVVRVRSQGEADSWVRSIAR